MDEYSDLDLVVVEDTAHAAVMEQRREIAAEWMPLLAAFTGEHVGEPRLLICLRADPLLHVGLKFVTSGELQRRIEDPAVVWERGSAATEIIATSDPTPVTADAQWIEDRFWIWIHYAAIKLGRGELFEVLEFLGLLRSWCLSRPVISRSGSAEHGPRQLRVPHNKNAAAARTDKRCPEERPPHEETVVHDSADDEVEDTGAFRSGDGWLVVDGEEVPVRPGQFGRPCDQLAQAGTSRRTRTRDDRPVRSGTEPLRPHVTTGRLSAGSRWTS